MSAVSCTVTEVMVGCFAYVWMLCSISQGYGKEKISFQLKFTLSAQEWMDVRGLWLCSQTGLAAVCSLFSENGALLCGWTLTGRGAALQKESWECWWIKTSGLGECHHQAEECGSSSLLSAGGKTPGGLVQLWASQSEGDTYRGEPIQQRLLSWLWTRAQDIWGEGEAARLPQH